MANNHIRIILLGDSITTGIGSKKISYEPLLLNKLGQRYQNIEIINMAKSGSTILYLNDIYRDINALNPDIVISMYGNVDVQEHYDLSKNKFGLVSLTPKRYKNVGAMLNPRPYISKKPIKKILDYLDNAYRYVWRRVIEVTQGKIQFLTVDYFSDLYAKTLELLGAKNIVVCSTIFPDKRIYGERNDSIYVATNDNIKAICSMNNNLHYVDLYTEIKKTVYCSGWSSVYYRDHFHPNEIGYELIAELLSNAIFNIIDTGE